MYRPSGLQDTSRELEVLQQLGALQSERFLTGSQIEHGTVHLLRQSRRSPRRGVSRQD